MEKGEEVRGHLFGFRLTTTMRHPTAEGQHYTWITIKNDGCPLSDTSLRTISNCDRQKRNNIKSERWGVGCLGFVLDGGVGGGDGDLEWSDGMMGTCRCVVCFDDVEGFAILLVAFLYVLYVIARWACTRSSTNNGSIQFTLDVILVLFLILVVRVINGLWLCDSRLRRSSCCLHSWLVGLNMKVIDELARSRYSGWVPATNRSSSSGRVHFHHGQLLLLPVGWYWSSVALYARFCTGMLDISYCVPLGLARSNIK
eukprot:scaffold12254_cov28-Attheya_sp.AAC.1